MKNEIWKNKPNCFLVGAPKCGTTSIYHYMSQHPDIFVSHIKEPHFFSTDLKPLFSIRDEREYAALFDGAYGKKIIAECSASYLFSEDAAAKIFEFNPEAKIVIILRNPTDMLYSLHGERVFSGGEHLERFEDALAAEEPRIRGEMPSKGGFFAYRKVGNYLPQVKRYYDIFPSHQIKVFLYDDLQTNSINVMKEIFAFLQVSSLQNLSTEVHNSAQVVRFRFIRKFVVNPPRPIIEVGKKILPQQLRRSIVRRLENLTSKNKKRKSMDPLIRTDLVNHFRPTVLELQEFLNRDLQKWLS